MKLPNAERAEVDPIKVRDYLLSPDHPDGRSKARFFGALGFAGEGWPLLRDALLAVAREGEAEPGAASVFGQKYVARGIIRGRAAAPRGGRRGLDRPAGRRRAAARDRLPRGGSAMTTMATEAPYRELDRVALVRDVPEAGLRAGDLGTVVWVYGAEAVEVEFVTHAGRTAALRTLAVADVRPVAGNDLPAVRPVGVVPGAA